MIARTWHGWTLRKDVETYLKYLDRTGVSSYQSTPGNRGVYVFWRAEGTRAEFLLISLWESLDAIRLFAGDRIDRAVFYPEDDLYLVERDRATKHFQVALHNVRT